MGVFFDLAICYFTDKNSMPDQNDLTNRQTSMLKGPLLSLTFSVLYTAICGAGSLVTFGLELPSDEMLFCIMTCICFFYLSLTPALALYLMSRAEKSEERMTTIELRDRRFNRELEWAQERKRNQDFLAEVKRLLGIEEDIFEV